ncbi:MAG: ECF transporter S component [Armatimonadetes bacterium]|nr:ECF transporter S component [Armatimonadota bacterium]MDW8029629.1 ECF transporter S component [Armatimonadota bacterium]
MEERKLEMMREILVASLFAALGVIVPILFHLVGLGRVFLPMHLPILASGFFVSPIVAGAAGFVTPLVSSFLTGMPPLPIAIAMSIELATLASFASICYRFFGKMVQLQKGIGKIISVLSSTIAAIVARIFVDLILIATVIAPLLQLPAGAFGLASVLVGMPGIILQLTIVPAVVLAIEQVQRVKGLWTSER